MPSPLDRGEGHGSSEEPGSAAVRDPPGVGGAECIEGGGGNWRGPPRPGSLRMMLPGRDVLPVIPGSGSLAGRESEAAVVPVEPQDNTTCGDGGDGKDPGRRATRPTADRDRAGPVTAVRPGTVVLTRHPIRLIGDMGEVTGGLTAAGRSCPQSGAALIRRTEARLAQVYGGRRRSSAGPSPRR